MVVIDLRAPTVINAYSTTLLTDAMIRTVQHAFYDATYARFGNPLYVVAIHDRPEFHGISHYDLRNLLDAENATEAFIVIDQNTPDNDAIWYVPDTETCKHDGAPTYFPKPPIAYPGENFTLWQAHMRISDVPCRASFWSLDPGEILDILSWRYQPYDPHGPQNHIISTGRNWTDPQEVREAWGHVLLGANWTDVEWSTGNDHKPVPPAFPIPPVWARLTARPARKAGLLAVWTWQEQMGAVGEEVYLFADYDADSPIWPTGYPDDPRGSASGNISIPVIPHGRDRLKELYNFCALDNGLEKSLTASQLRRAGA